MKLGTNAQGSRNARHSVFQGTAPPSLSLRPGKDTALQGPFGDWPVEDCSLAPTPLARPPADRFRANLRAGFRPLGTDCAAGPCGARGSPAASLSSGGRAVTALGAVGKGGGGGGGGDEVVEVGGGDGQW